jgi:hypothetical protein
VQFENRGIEFLDVRLSHSTPMLVASSLDAGPGVEMPHVFLVAFIPFSWLHHIPFMTTRIGGV